MTKLILFMSPTHKQMKNGFFVGFFLYKKQHSYSFYSLRFEFTMLPRIIFINRKEDFYVSANVTYSHTGIQYKVQGVACFFSVFLEEILLVFWCGCSCVKTSVRLSRQMKLSGI